MQVLALLDRCHNLRLHTSQLKNNNNNNNNNQEKLIIFSENKIHDYFLNKIHQQISITYSD